MLSPHQLAVALLLIAAGFPATSPAASLSQSVPAFPIYHFSGSPDGATPSGGLVQDSQGRLYGATQFGGTMGQGAIYRLTRQSGQKWTEEILYSFSGPDGDVPEGPLTLDASDNVYGMTSTGGIYNFGTAFRLANSGTSWSLTTLHSFGAPQDGTGLLAGLTFGPNGNLFGVTEAGGASGFGTVFELSPGGDTVFYSKLHDFIGGSDGAAPVAGLVAKKGYLVGTTFGGGTNNTGTIFTLSQGAIDRWKVRIVYSFGTSSNDVAGPVTAQGFAADYQGGFIGCGPGGPFGKGGVFAVMPQSGGAPWNESVLYAFGKSSADPGARCDLIEGPSGVIYGTAPYGGDAKKPAGVIFSLAPPSGGNPSWTETNLINLATNGFLGANPLGAVLRKNRVFYAVSPMSRNGRGLDFVFAPF